MVLLWDFGVEGGIRRGVGRRGGEEGGRGGEGGLGEEVAARVWEEGLGQGGSCVDSKCWEGVGWERQVVDQKGEAKVRVPWL